MCTDHHVLRDADGPSHELLRGLATQIKVLAAILAVSPSTAEIPIMMTVLAHTTARARPFLDAHEPRVSLLLDQAQQQAVEMRDDAARSDLVAAHGHLLAVLRHIGDSPGADVRAREPILRGTSPTAANPTGLPAYTAQPERPGHPNDDSGRCARRQQETSTQE